MTQREPGELFLEDETGELQIKTAQMAWVHPGSRVEVLGFPALADAELVVEDAILREVGAQPDRPPANIVSATLAVLRDTLPTLTTVKHIHRLTASEAKRKYSVRLRGVLTVYNPTNQYVFLQDSTGAIFSELRLRGESGTISLSRMRTHLTASTKNGPNL